MAIFTFAEMINNEDVRKLPLKLKAKWKSPVSRPGIVFTKEQTAKIKELCEAGNIVEAQRMILKWLDDVYGKEANI